MLVLFKVVIWYFIIMTLLGNNNWTIVNKKKYTIDLDIKNPKYFFNLFIYAFLLN